MNCQNPHSGKEQKHISKFCPLKFLPRVLRVKRVVGFICGVSIVVVCSSSFLLLVPW